MIEKLIVDVIVGGVVALLGIFAKWQWPAIKGLFDEENRNQAAQISGSWEATENFLATNTKNRYVMEISCRSGRVTGKHVCTDGFDKGKTFDLRGTYKDHILTFTWTPKPRHALESGTVTAKLFRDGMLEGHGLYIEPDDGKVYTSTYEAIKN